MPSVWQCGATRAPLWWPNRRLIFRMAEAAVNCVMKTGKRTSNLINRTDWKISLPLSFSPFPSQIRCVVCCLIDYRAHRPSVRLCKADIMLLLPPPPPLATVQYIPYCIPPYERTNERWTRAKKRRESMGDGGDGGEWITVATSVTLARSNVRLL